MIEEVGGWPPRWATVRWIVPIVLGIVASTALAGCGSSGKPLRAAVVDRALASSVLARIHLVTHVTCPTSISGGSGHTFACRVQLAAGSTSIDVTEHGAADDLVWSFPHRPVLLDTRRVMASIRRAVKRQRGVSSRVVCPSQVLQQTGVRFACFAIVRKGARHVKAGTYRFEVAETNDYGRVAYVGI